MKNQRLVERVASLSDREAAAVDQFINYLQNNSRTIPDENFQAVLDSFVREHSDLLKRLAE